MLLRDLHGRLLNRPQLNSDGFRPYADAIAVVFGPQSVDYGMIVKDANMRKTAVFGDPDLEQISTSLIERVNLTTPDGAAAPDARTPIVSGWPTTGLPLPCTSRSTTGAGSMRRCGSRRPWNSV